MDTRTVFRIGVGALAAFSLHAQQPDMAALRAEFAPTGRLRAAINHGNPVLASRDTKTGELRGVTVDLSRELGRRLGLPVDLVPFDAAGKVSAAAKEGVWDVAYLAIDLERAQDIDYTAPYVELEGTYLVLDGSKLRNIEDADRARVRIAVSPKSAYDLFLSRNLKQARIVRPTSAAESLELLAKRELDAVAGVRTALVTASRTIPGSRVMKGRFMTIPQAAGLPKGRPQALRFLQEYIEGAKTSGFVAAALKRHGMTDDDAIVPGAKAQ
ncbi:MAG: ABC transporter substrate-binding protein [Bryobacteraceae bacterium]